jgi:hypothetical protein
MFSATRVGFAVAIFATALVISVPMPAMAGGGCVFFNANDTDCDGLDDTTVDPCPGTPAVSSPGLLTTLNRCAGPVATCAAAAGNCGAIGEAIRYDAFPTAPTVTTDCNTDSWLGESGTVGNAVGTGVAIDPTSVSAVFGCTDATTQQMLIDERWLDPIVRSYPVPNGTYVVNILWAEAFSGVCTFNGGLGAGSRQCDVIVEGVVEYPLFDQYLEADLQDDGLNNGTGCSSLVVTSVVATVTDGALDISLDELDPSPGDGNCNLKAIEVLALPATCTVPGDCDDGNPCTDDVCNGSNFCENNPNTDPCDDGNSCTSGDACSAGTCAGVTDPDGTSCDDGNLCTDADECTGGVCDGTFNDPDNDGLGGVCDPCPSQALNDCCGPVAVHDAGGVNGTFPGPLDVRLNTNVSAAGCSGAKTDCRGAAWNADFAYNVAASASTCNLANGCPVDSTGLFGCTDAATEDLFKCEHWDAAAAPELLYTFDVPNGPYVVNLLFMNSFSGSALPGQRVFDAAIEGQLVLEDFDQVLAAGGVCDPNVSPCLPVNRAFRADVADGTLDIELLHGLIENTAIKGIEVLQCGCQVDGDCDDGNSCTTDTCNAAGVCQNANVPDATVCDDGLACNEGESCTAGVCGGGAATDCSGTGNQCQADSTCDAGGAEGNCDTLGAPINDSLPCDDGLACNVGETCQSGLCVISFPPDCSGTGDQCNADSTCDPGGAEGNCDIPGGAINEGLACSDGLACNEGETCQSGSCNGGTATDCSGTGDQCNADSTCDAGGAEGNCDTPGGAINEGLACNDGLACNEGETCTAGACNGGTATDCSGTGDQCNADSTCDAGGAEGNCDTPGGPTNEGLACDDGAACNVGETCQSGACTGGAPADCSGTGDQCNADNTCDAGGAEGNCDIAGGPTNEGLPCDDGAACNVGETCSAGACSGGGAADCTGSGGDCATDGACDTGGAEGNCDLPGGPINEGGACDDGDACNVGETCASGVCTGGSAQDCSGTGDDCNADSTCDAGGAEGNCDTPGGAINEGGACDDGNACNVGETCTAGSCGGGSAPDCSTSGDQCNDASCNAAGADGNCDTLTPVTDGTVCDDSSVCSTDDECAAGACVGLPVDCGDGNPCTQDSCDAILGCESTAGPATVCFEAGKSNFQVRQKADPSKNQLKWKWNRGDETIQADTGDPSISTTYALCVYDQTGAVPSLAATLVIAPNAFWDNKDPKGWNYKDKGGAEDGIQKAQLKTGTAGKSKAQVKAKGINIPMPVPVGPDQYFNEDPGLIVQFLSSEGQCWNTEFASPARKNDGEQYKTKSP